MQGDRKGLPYMSPRCQMEGRPLRSPCPLQTVISSRLTIGGQVGTDTSVPTCRSNFMCHFSKAGMQGASAP